jgi:hypothetical protein
MSKRSVLAGIVGSAAALAAAGGAWAAEPAAVAIRMGDGTVDGSILKPYSNVWLYTLTDKDGRVIPQGMWSDHLQMTKVDGRPAWLRVQGTTFVNGRTSSTLNVFDPVTLQPFSSRQQGVNGKTQTRTFTGAHLKSERAEQLGGPAVTSEVDLGVTPYDFNGGMYGMILATLPLRAGLSGAFATVEESEDKAAVDTFKVLGQEDMSAGALGTRKTWKVVSERPGQYRMTFWLIKTAPYIIKLEYAHAASPMIWDWTMI